MSQQLPVDASLSQRRLVTVHRPGQLDDVRPEEQDWFRARFCDDALLRTGDARPQSSTASPPKFRTYPLPTSTQHMRVSNKATALRELQRSQLMHVDKLRKMFEKDSKDLEESEDSSISRFLRLN